MEPFRFHVFVCDQQKPEGVPCCRAHGSAELIEALRREVTARGLDDEVQITACGSLGLCAHGPNMVVYPDGIWYSGLTPSDVPIIVESHFRQDTPVESLARTDLAGLRAEILDNRSRMQAALRAREAAGVLPDDLNALVRGFQESRAVLTALELDLFTAVGDGADAAEVAARLNSDARATEMLLNVLVSLRLLAKEGGRFRNTPVSARFFTAASPVNARPALMHTAHLWERWSTLTACVRAGTAVAARDDSARSDDWTEAFIAAMHRNATERAPHVIRAVGAGEARRLLDVGGGSGAYSIAFAQAIPSLRAEILDRPEVGAIALRHIRQAGLESRIAVRAGDLRTDPFGEGYDLIFVSAICHMLDPAENLDLLRRCHAALAPGGRVVIQDFILDQDKTSPRFAALFSLNMLVGTRGGASYSESEYTAWLGEAGFAAVRRAALPGITDLIIATR